MKRISIIVLATILLGATAFTQENITNFGEREFKANCAACHGANAKGNGTLVSSLKVAPPDLTLLAKKNGGEFPIKRMYDVIDGRTKIAAHRSRDMPIWGTRYSANAPQNYNQAAYVRTRIINLIDYLQRIQQK